MVAAAATAAKSLQSCPTLFDPTDSSPPGSAVPGILQARTLEWVAISFSNAWKWKVKGKLLSGVRLFVSPWTAAYQAPPSMGFSRQEYWSGLPLPPWTPRILELDHSIYSRELYSIQNKASGTSLDPGKGWASDYGTSSGHVARCGLSEQAVSSGMVDSPALHCKMGEEPSWYGSHRTRGYK